MDNDDETIFSSPKSLIGLFFLGTITIYVIYWIYNNIIKDNQANQNPNNILNIFNANQNINNNNKKKQIIKQKMSINMSLLMKDSKKSILEDIKILYDLFDKLSDYYNLYLLIYIEDNINAEKIKDELLKYLEPIINDNIVHIENNNYIVVQLIRYINEFWFVKSKNEKDEILKKVEKDSNNAKQNINDLMSKIKFYSNFNQVIDKEIKTK